MTDFKYFVDTAPYIYCLEGEKASDLTKRAKTFFKNEFSNGSTFVTSSITFEEYLVHPYRDKDDACVSRFYGFIKTTETSVIHIDEGIADRASRIRAEYTSFRAMDALQLATACETGCDIFLTNDKRLRQFKDIKISVLEELPFDDAIEQTSSLASPSGEITP